MSPFLHFDVSRVVLYRRLARLDKPQGAILVFWPFAWGLTLAAYRSALPLSTFSILFVQFLIGSFLLRGAAVTFNDICDREFDQKVERTKTRPIASGAISVTAATVFLTSEILLCVAHFWSLNRPAFTATMFGLILLAGIYPLMKRVTYWPQAWLGLTANWGLIIAWLTIYRSIDYSLVISILIGMWCWTMLYDTIYACQDKRDDVQAGVKSTAILFGSWTKPLLSVFGTIFVSMLAYSGYLNGHGLPYYAISVGFVALHVFWQLWTVNLEDSSSCWDNFRRNSQLGLIAWIGMLLDYLRILRYN